MFIDKNIAVVVLVIKKTNKKRVFLFINQSNKISDKNDSKMIGLKLNELLNNKEKLLKYKHNAFEFGKIFSIGYIKEEWVEVINKYGK